MESQMLRGEYDEIISESWKTYKNDMAIDVFDVRMLARIIKKSERFPNLIGIPNQWII